MADENYYKNLWDEAWRSELSLICKCKDEQNKLEIAMIALYNIAYPCYSGSQSSEDIAREAVKKIESLK